MEAFGLLAEIAVGLAGFSGVAVIVGRGPGRWSAGDAARIRLLLGAAFGALFPALVPIGLASAGLPDAVSVQAGAGVLLVALTLWGVTASRSFWRLPPEERSVFDPRIYRLLRVLVIGAQAALGVAAAGLAGRATGAVLFFGVFLLLGYSAFGFVRLMFVRPGSDGAA